MEEDCNSEGFERVNAEEGSFGRYLRTLPLKPDGARVVLQRRRKPADVHVAAGY